MHITTHTIYLEIVIYPCFKTACTWTNFVIIFLLSEMFAHNFQDKFLLRKCRGTTYPFGSRFDGLTSACFVSWKLEMSRVNAKTKNNILAFGHKQKCHAKHIAAEFNQFFTLFPELSWFILVSATIRLNMNCKWSSELWRTLSDS